MQIKTATTVAEQISRLKQRGMTISDIKKAEEVLLDIGYYRLGFYWFPFENQYPNKHRRDHIFCSNASFDDVLNLYYFDNDLRAILTPYLHRIEIHLRTTLIYIVSNYYRRNPTWFSDSKIVAHDFITRLPALYDDIKKNDTIKHHHRKYPNDIYAPAWKTLEYMTFGSILYLIENLKNIKIQEYIAQSMGINNLDVFFSHMQTLRILRNACAHGHNIFDLKLSKSIKPGPINGMSASQRNSVSGALMVVANTLGCISVNRQREFIDKVNTLILSSASQPISHIIRHIVPISQP